MLLERLINIQRAMGVSDRRFAALLRVDDALWTNTRLGKRPIRYEVLRGAAQAFPDNEALQADIIAHLQGSPARLEAAALSA